MGPRRRRRAERRAGAVAGVHDRPAVADRRRGRPLRGRLGRGSAYAAAIQRFVVAPNEQVRETEFIEHNIQATRAASSKKEWPSGR